VSYCIGVLSNPSLLDPETDMFGTTYRWLAPRLCGMSVDAHQFIEETDAPTDEPIEQLDVRNLGPPKPLSETLERLAELDEGVLVQLNDRAPQHLYPKLADRGYRYETRDTGDAVVTLIWEE